ncbi:hypothetical protein V7S43_003793 [Phytophthora oleae]|uniref:Uncharacterized protein n=1 Tax=Phytophthora oleae TaxID=2107226 RepID=A0ABD3FY67_9STRA
MNLSFNDSIQWQYLEAGQGAEEETEPSNSSSFCADDLSSTASVARKEKSTCPVQGGSEISSTKPKKKRIRRQKLELDYLRKLVVSLEEKISDLKVKQSYDNEGATTNSTGEGLLHKRPRDEETKALADAKRFKPSGSAPLSPTGEEIFADQLAHVQRAHLDVDRIFGGPGFADNLAPFYNFLVKNDSDSNTGVAFVKKVRSMLPFDIEVAEKAFWRTLAEEGTKKDSYFIDERLTSENLVASSYGLEFRAGEIHANVLGKRTYRKYVTDDKVVIMWKWVVDPVEVNGSKFCGVQCHETGWIVLRTVDVANADVPEIGADLDAVPSKTLSTQLQSYAEMAIELQDDVANQKLQIGAFTNFVVNMHETITEVRAKMITNVLVEEDWNLNGWLGTMVP